jgi:hypothetical protein
MHKSEQHRKIKKMGRSETKKKKAREGYERQWLTPVISAI